MYRENYHSMELPELFREEAATIESLYLYKGEMVSFEPTEHVLWIVKKGSFSLVFANGKKEFIQNGQLFFLPIGSVCTLTIEQGSHLTGFYLPDCLALCEYFLPSGLANKKSAWNTSFNPVEIAPLIWEYCRHLHILFEECQVSAAFRRIKIYELFYLLKSCYTPQELAGLFYPVLRKESSFAKFIYTNYMHVKTVQELASAANMSLKSFENRFNLVFGTSPGRWMIGKKGKKFCGKLFLLTCLLR